MTTAFIRGGRLFEGTKVLLFSQHFQQARTFLEHNKTRDNTYRNFFVGRGWGWVHINFLGFQGGYLFKVKNYLKVGS